MVLYTIFMIMVSIATRRPPLRPLARVLAAVLRLPLQMAIRVAAISISGFLDDSSSPAIEM